MCACILMLILPNEDEVRETNALQSLKPFRYLRQTVNGTTLELSGLKGRRLPFVLLDDSLDLKGFITRLLANSIR